jgi:4-hydroxybenzoate polyprenyltransferase
MLANHVVFSTSLVLGFISWFLLCGGIVVFNSYYDKDVGPVAGLEKPPTSTFSMFVGAWLLKLSGFIIALFLNNIFLIAYIMGVILSVLYSHEKFRFKSNGYVAILFNFIIGATTFIVTSFFSPTINTGVLFFGSISAGIFLAAIYLMMQVHQREEDKARRDNSIMVLYGRKITLTLVLYLMIISAILSTITFVLSDLPWFYIWICMVYFIVILFISRAWLDKQGGPTSDFKIMNKLTMGLCYTANVLVATIYILEAID